MRIQIARLKQSKILSTALIRTFPQRTFIKFYSTTPKFSDFNYKDALNIETLLTPEEIQTRDAANGYCQQKLKPRVLKGFREETFDRRIMNEMGEMGLLV